MKAVILAGGMGTRISEETIIKPKPLIEIGEKPILWHIMKIYSSYGINDFVICCGYKGHMIKDYFSNYALFRSDVTFNMAENQMEVHRNHVEPWRVTLIDTGLDTMNGSRLKRVRDYVGDGTFCFTYGDGLSDVNIRALIEFHRARNTIATVTATHHYSRFGILTSRDSRVTNFTEKPIQDGSWMNSGFFVLEPKIFDYIEGDGIAFEKEPLQALIQEGQLSSFFHDGFFQGMDSLRDRTLLEELWKSGKAPWKVWQDEVVVESRTAVNATEVGR